MVSNWVADFDPAHVALVASFGQFGSGIEAEVHPAALAVVGTVVSEPEGLRPAWCDLQVEAAPVRHSEGLRRGFSSPDF